MIETFLSYLNQDSTITMMVNIGSMALLFIGLFGLLTHRHVLRIFISVSIMEIAIYLFFIGNTFDKRFTAPILGDGHNLPFKDGAFDLIICEAVFEHLNKPWVAVNEFFRVLKTGGFIYAETAFMQPFHGWPNHYFNMTKEGIRVLFEKFQEIGCGGLF